MRGNNGVKFFSVIIVIGILTWISIFAGPSILGYSNKADVKSMRTGIDIRGGVDARLYAITKNGAKPSQSDLDSAKATIEKRLDFKNILDREVTVDASSGYIIVRIPWPKNEKNFDPNVAIADIGQTALLTFQEVDETKKNPDGTYQPTGKIILQGKEISNAKAEIDPNTGSYGIGLTFTSEASKKFSEATGRLVGKPIAIFLDQNQLSAPNVKEQINTTEARIDGTFTADEAKQLANNIKSGALPFSLEAKQVSAISPTLGQNALDVSVKALIFALILVWLFMLLYYRLPGILANIALLAHTVIQLIVISLLGLTITLPGIAGIILTIGMGVDANIIIFERIKEELRNGKTLRAAIDVGFKRAFTAVLDANMTTLISAVVLYAFGTGAIQNFAITLGLGVALSFLTAVVVSRIMLKSVADVDIAKHHWLYGA